MRLGRSVMLGGLITISAMGTWEPPPAGEPDNTTAGSGSADGPSGSLRSSVSPHPIHRACERLQEAERLRIALPDRTLPLEEAIEIAVSGSGLRIDMDWPSLDAVGVRASLEVRSNGRPGPVDVVLRQLFNGLGDAWERPRIEATAEGLVVTTRAGATGFRAPMAHPIGDLLTEVELPSRVPLVPEDGLPEEARDGAAAPERPSGESRAEAPRRLADLVLDLCDWQAWEANGGGLARLRIVDDALMIDGPPSIQVAVARLLDQLRVTRPRRLEVRAVILARDSERIDRIRMDHPPGSLAFVRAVERLAGPAPILRQDLELVLDEPGFARVRTDELEAEFEIEATWDRQRRTVIAVVDCRLEGDLVDGRRELRTTQELRVPTGGLVVPLPAGGDQVPMALLIWARTR